MSRSVPVSIGLLGSKPYELNARRLVYEGLFILLLATILTVLALVLWPSVAPLVVALIVAPLVYLLCHYPRGLSWALPRRRHHLHSVAVCFIGAFLFATAVMSVVGEPTQIASAETLKLVLATACGAFAFLYAAVKIGTPTHVGIVVDCEAVSNRRQFKGANGNSNVLSYGELKKRLDKGEKTEQILHGATAEVDSEEEKTLVNRMNDIGLLCCRSAPGIWPDHFEVSQEGSVVWYLFGKPGTRVTILFDQGFDPFAPSAKRNGNPSWFTGVVPAIGAPIPGFILAGPIVNPGRGAYRMIVDYPNGRSVERLVHGAGAQRRG
ncbi:MAG: hypothetical protein ACRD1X_18110 [Vicinamibacteria bacterium]